MSGLPDKTTTPPWWERQGVQPTDLEVADWLVRTSDANRDAWFDRMRKNSAQASNCWMGGHEDVIDRLRRDLKTAHERIAWLERNYAVKEPS